MKRGFTLIELLAVVLIMGVLTAVAVPQYKRSLERSRAAEPSQMLPAIFDARERLIIERDVSWEKLLLDETYRQSEVPFSRLDIELKGVYKDGNPNVWETTHFIYYLFDDNDKTLVSAEPKSEKYTGTKIYFNGQCLTCEYTKDNKNGCEIYNIENCD